MIEMETIILVDCTEVPSSIQEYLLDKYEYGCHCDHTVLQIEDDGNPFAEWLKSNGYKFKNKLTDYPSWDLVALYGT